MARKATQDYNLAVKYPGLIKDWHPTKNGTLTPMDVLPASHKEAWWKCEKGHEWDARIANRTILGQTCPYCSNKRVGTDYNLAVRFPAVAKDWHPNKNGKLTPGDVVPRSNKRVWWRCKNGHEWDAVISSRTNGTNCPFCSGRRARADNNLAVKRPDIAKEWHPTKNGNLTPFNFTPGSGRKVWWKCEKGHEWDARIANRATLGRGCPYCSNKAVGNDNNLAVKFPAVAKEWHPTKNGRLTARDVLPGSHRIVWWKCGKGHEWDAKIKDRTGQGSGCTYCSGHRVGDDNNLGVKLPELAKEWHPTKNGNLTARDVVPGSHKQVWWKCRKKGHEWEASLKNRVKGRGCPYCSNKAIGDDNSLAVVFLEITKEWHPTKNGNLKPADVPPSGARKVWWTCKRGHEWQATINNRTHNGRGCPDCHPQTSRLEIRIFCELKTIFNDLKWREKINGVECDIYLPTHKLGIELDGGYWHKGKDREEYDRAKGIQLHKRGVSLYRIRENTLRQISSMDIFYSRRERDGAVINRLLRNLLRNIAFTPEDQSPIHSSGRGVDTDHPQR